MQRGLGNSTDGLAEDERVVDFPQRNELRGLSQLAMQFLERADGGGPVGGAVEVDQALPQPVGQVADRLHSRDGVEREQRPKLHHRLGRADGAINHVPSLRLGGRGDRVLARCGWQLIFRLRACHLGRCGGGDQFDGDVDAFPFFD